MNVVPQMGSSLKIIFFLQDCNGDGAVDCYDFAVIHQVGGYECETADQIDPLFLKQVETCRARFHIVPWADKPAYLEKS